MAVIGLGKLGGSELNYSSDIDLMFVYQDTEDEAVGTPERKGGREPERKGSRESAPDGSVHEYANRLAERTVQLLSESSPEGHFYRVDVRLRPESGAGPVALPLARFLTYYESRGELWERQMLIKGRCIAGDRPLGERFFRQLESFVYPRTFFSNPFESIVRLKSRIEAAANDPWNIKTMRGGIRDIEFSVQALQLLNGGKNPRVRKGGTLDAIEALSEASLLTAEESTALASAYEFYRTLEHRLQTRLNTQTHTVPEDAAERSMLSRTMGLKDEAGLLRSIKDRQNVVRAIFERILQTQGGKDEVTLATLLESGLPEARQREILGRFGFTDPAGAMKHLRVLMTGSSLGSSGDMDARARGAFRAVAPALLEDIGRTPDPDLTLEGLPALFAGRADAGQMYDQLQLPRFRKLVIEICSRSPRMARALSRRPLLLDTIARDPGPALAGFSGLPSTGEPLAVRKEQVECVSCLRFLFGHSGIDAFTGELSAIADAVVTEVLEAESRRLRYRGAPLAVIALGKHGSRELSLDADLDLLFLGDPSQWRRKPAALDALAANVVTRLGEVTPAGRLYEVDARLRPEGRNAPLVTEPESFLRYLNERASLWERQSLTRFRWIAGDEQVVARIRVELQKLVYESPLPAGWVGTILKMRKTMESRIRTRGPAPVDLKLGRGGLVDVEFIAQMGMLRAGRRGRGLGVRPGATQPEGETAPTGRAPEAPGGRTPKASAGATPKASAGRTPDVSGGRTPKASTGQISEESAEVTPASAASQTPLTAGEHVNISRTRQVTAALPLLHDLVDPASLAKLADCYSHFRSAQAFMRLTLEDRGNLLPEGRQLERLARVHSGMGGAEYRADILRRMEDVRTIVDAAAQELSSEDAQ
jgi:glutamate-ammonia-ligase adenylyltransferase